jgi:hypothetical protein
MFFAMLISALLIPSPQTIPAADRPPVALSTVRDTALGVYTAAIAADWPAVTERFDALKSAMADLPSRLGKPDLVLQLKTRTQALQDAIKDQRSPLAAANANWIARLTDEIASQYETSMPADVDLLGYFGRALEVDSYAAREKATTDLADLRTVWRRVEPIVLRRNGVDAARHFSDALAQLDGAADAVSLRAGAEAELRAANAVVALFRRPPAA